MLVSFYRRAPRWTQGPVIPAEIGKGRHSQDGSKPFTRKVPGFGFRVGRFVFRVSVSGVRGSGSVFRISCFGFRIPSCEFGTSVPPLPHASEFGVQRARFGAPVFGSRVSSSWWRVWGSFRMVWGLGSGAGTSYPHP